MPALVHLDHLIVHAADREESAAFLAGILGLEVGEPAGPFLPVVTGNGVTLDFVTVPASHIALQHYAFQVVESEFDAVFGRLRETGAAFFADPHREKPGEINRNDGGYGVYFLDPAGHAMEVLTRPYGGTERDVLTP